MEKIAFTSEKVIKTLSMGFCAEIFTEQYAVLFYRDEDCETSEYGIEIRKGKFSSEEVPIDIEKRYPQSCVHYSNASKEECIEIAKAIFDNYEILSITYANADAEEFDEYEDDDEDEYYGFLVCKKCGYKQLDQETVRTFKERFSDICVYDIPYYCGACQDTADDEEYEAMQEEMKS